MNSNFTHTIGSNDAQILISNEEPQNFLHVRLQRYFGQFGYLCVSPPCPIYVHFTPNALSVRIAHRRFRYFRILNDVFRTIMMHNTLSFPHRRADYFLLPIAQIKLMLSHQTIISNLKLYSHASCKNNSTFVSRLLIGQQPHACQSQVPLQAAAKNRCKRAAARLLLKQNIEIYLADSTPCTRVALVHGISITNFFKFQRNLVIPIGMAEYCVKSGRIPLFDKIGMVGNYVII